jgi:regulator of sigma E protease
LDTVLYAFEIAVALGLIVLTHEAGHFLAAKWCGVWVRRFAIGFGPPLIKWTRGDTEYSLRILPLGGFVEPMGDTPESEGGDSPRALWRKPAWQKIAIFSAGVVMNALLAMILFGLAPIVGVEAPLPVVGGVLPDMPAAQAGIQPGDRIVRINGNRVESFEDVIWTVALVDADTAFNLEIERPVPGSEEPEVLTKTVVSVRKPKMLAPMLGIEPQIAPVIARISPDSPLAQAGFLKGDRIVAVNGKSVGTWRELEKTLTDAPAGPVNLAMERQGEPEDLRVDPADLKVYDFGMTFPTQIESVEPGSPAEEAGIQAGDRVAAIRSEPPPKSEAPATTSRESAQSPAAEAAKQEADSPAKAPAKAGAKAAEPIVPTQTQPWPTGDTIAEVVKAAGDGGLVHLTLWRDGQAVAVACKTAMLPGTDHPRIGIAMAPAIEEPLQIGSVDKDGPADRAGIRPGDLVVAMGEDSHQPGDWVALIQELLESDGQPVPIQVKRGGNLLAATLEPKLVRQDRLSAVGAIGSVVYGPMPRLYNPLAAAERGVRKTVLWLGRVYLNLKQLVTGQVSAKAAAGPVGIVQFSLDVASHGIGAMMDFWGMLAVSIAVLNFLPIPPFDGGHVLFVLIEKIRGAPVSVKVRSWIWGAGWAAVGALFLFVTYRDILRLVGVA